MVIVIVVLCPGNNVTGPVAVGAATLAAGADVVTWVPTLILAAVALPCRSRLAMAGSAPGSTPAAQTSPVVERRAGSNSWPRATAAMLNEPDGAGPLNG